ncbi:hypothetical protein JCM3774_003472 [Rhodotorula dairenensis]
MHRPLQPTAALPALAPTPPPPAALASTIASLHALLFPPAPVVDLRTPREILPGQSASAPERDERGQDVVADEFEVDFARDWLNRVVALGTRKFASGQDDAVESWEGVVDGAAKLLADLSGPCAQGASTRTYILPHPLKTTLLGTGTNAASFYPTPPPSRPPSVARERVPTSSPPQRRDDLSLTLRDGTQLEASTGHRTWGAATLFAHLLATRSGAFFPWNGPGESDYIGSSVLRVLEVGSGTGLVGMAAAKVLKALLPHGQARGAEVILSDGGDEPDAVLENLRYNVSANFSSPVDASTTVDVGVQELDWRDFLARSNDSASGLALAAPPRYHIIFGSDLAYERGQATLLHAAVAAHLEFPSSCATTVPTFHLMLPLRPTHRIEMDEVESVFPPAQQLTGPAAPLRPDLVRRADTDSSSAYFRLVTVVRERFVAPDGFGANFPAGVARGNAADRRAAEMTYELRRIVWEAVGP